MTGQKKDESPPVVLTRPKSPKDVHLTKPLEWFRIVVNDYPYVAMRMEARATLLLIDKVGQLSTIDVSSIASRNTMTFIDYLTEDEGVWIPGSSTGREDAEPEIPLPSALIRPDPPECIDQIPDGITFHFVGGGYATPKEGWEARNFTAKNGSRYTLLFGRTGRHPTQTYVHCQNNGSGWNFVEYIEETDESRWNKHRVRKQFEFP